MTGVQTCELPILINMTVNIINMLYTGRVFGRTPTVTTVPSWDNTKEIQDPPELHLRVTAQRRLRDLPAGITALPVSKSAIVLDEEAALKCVEAT